MLATLPLLAARRLVARAIAASGVSDLDDDSAAPASSPAAALRTRWTAPRVDNPYLVPPPACPECGAPVVRASACITCPACGWGRCG
ncbi:MAG: hypothetical protein KC489_11555 [Gemmatimonadetes bacterium]|nr:hypothetical protein [Gemmatimonadota bacterium]